MSQIYLEKLTEYQELPLKIAASGFWEIIQFRIQENPFRLFTFIIFFLAITHTLLATRIDQLAALAEAKWAEKNSKDKSKGKKHFGCEILRFLGEVEIIFAIWIIPLLIGITFFYNWNTAKNYLSHKGFVEPLFIIVILTIASTRPIIYAADKLLQVLAKFFNESIAAWWFLILTIGPILGSFITEPAAMTLAAILLIRKFYIHKPSIKLKYATLGLLFTNISIGGVLTSFAAPPVLIIAKKWHWDSLFMLVNFGWKSVLAIFISSTAYLLFFRKEFKKLEENRPQVRIVNDQKEERVPLWIIFVHLIFLLLVVLGEEVPVLFIGVFFFFLGFYQATKPFQARLSLKGPVLVGAFLASLLIHGELQGWWIDPILDRLTEYPLMLASSILSSFNDNAMITYLTSLIPDISPTVKYAIVCGAVAGGGLTIIANAPNPAGHFLLRPHYEKGISPLGLLKGALFPTAVSLGTYMFFLWLGIKIGRP